MCARSTRLIEKVSTRAVRDGYEHIRSEILFIARCVRALREANARAKRAEKRACLPSLFERKMREGAWKSHGSARFLQENLDTASCARANHSKILARPIDVHVSKHFNAREACISGRVFERAREVHVSVCLRVCDWASAIRAERRPRGCVRRRVVSSKDAFRDVRSPPRRAESRACARGIQRRMRVSANRERV